MPVFGAPEVILSDRGSVFKDRRFADLVTKKLSAYHIFTSPYYPQGNALNESSHKALEKSISCSLASGLTSFSDALHDATTVHNACPHSSTKESPYSMMFGREMILPDSQKWAFDVPDALRGLNLRSARLMTTLREKLAAQTPEERGDTSKEAYEVGEWVVYFFRHYESGKINPKGGPTLDYTPDWSLPAKIVEVRGRRLRKWNAGGRLNVVTSPYHRCYQLIGDVPICWSRQI